MQNYSQLLIILPCHTLEDFPIHYRGAEAANLLANWTALWHPALVAGCGKIPKWHSADNPDVKPAADGVCLAVVPSAAQSMLNPDLIRNLENANSLVVSDQSDRDALIEIAIQANKPAEALNQNLDPETAKNFLALGYAYLQVQIMTRQLRYSSNLDESYFEEIVVKAAIAATDGDTDLAQKGLTQCFDTLLAEKNAYYPVDPELFDVVLTAPTTLGRSLQNQLAVNHTINVLLTGDVANQLFTQHQESAAALRAAVDNERASLVGGLENELPDTLLSSESFVHQLTLGRSTLLKWFQRVPTIFLRRRFGLTPATPGILHQFDYLGAIHATFDDGKFPKSPNSIMRWTGDNESSLLASGDIPLSAADPGSFLGLGVRIGEAIDSAHLATLALVHWPDDTCQAFEDLRRITRFGPLFGNFISLEEYFDSAYDPGFGETFTADEYKTPFLKQAVESGLPNPISRYTTYWERFYQLASIRSWLIQTCAAQNLTAPTATQFLLRIEALQTQIESDVDRLSGPELGPEIDQLVNDLTQLWAGQGGSPSDQSTNPAQQLTELVNPTTFKRRHAISIPSQQSGTLKHALPVVLCDCDATTGNWVVEVPPMGTVVIDPTSPKRQDVFKSDPPIGQGNCLRNEFFSVQVDEATGGVRAIQLYGERGNYGSQQLALRIPSQRDGHHQPLSTARYTQMVADNVETINDSRLNARIVSRGRLLDGDSVVAKFVQTISVWRGKPVIEFDIQLELLTELSDSFNHYLCSRLAWKNESAQVVANSQESKSPVTSDWFHASNFFEVIQDDNRVCLLTGGLPYHRRVTRRIVDSLLIVGKEHNRAFRFGIGVNVPYPLMAATDRLTPVYRINRSPAVSGQGPGGWLFHFDCKNILATWWNPLFDADQKWSGVQIRIRETEGRAGKLTIRCPRPIANGDRVNFANDYLKTLDVRDDDPSTLQLDFGRFDYFQISIHWKS